MFNWHDVLVSEQRRRDERAAADEHRRRKAAGQSGPGRGHRAQAALGGALVRVGRRLQEGDAAPAQTVARAASR